MDELKIQFSLGPRVAYALAQLCKRIGFNDCLAISVDEDEAYSMINATDIVRAALEEVGISVR